MENEKFTLFWNGPYSQWNMAPFTVDEVEYNCCEQYMMAQKAVMFMDDKMFDEIMASNSPRQQKACGRKVKNFNAADWDSKARDIVYKANYAKFSQNKDLLKILMNTKGTTLVEASPYDKIWGIGMKSDNPKAQNRETWNGKNWLGEAITKVREDLIKEKE